MSTKKTKTDYRSIGLPKGCMLISCLPIVRKCGLYNANILRRGITLFTNTKQPNTFRIKAKQEILQMMLELIEHEMYELASAFTNIITFHYHYHDFDDDNIDNNPKKSTLVLGLCFDLNTISCVTKHGKECDDCDEDGFETLLGANKIVNNNNLSNVFQNTKYDEIKQCLYQMYCILKQSRKTANGRIKAQDRYNNEIKRLRNIIDKLLNSYNKLIKNKDKGEIDDKCPFTFEPINKEELIKEIIKFRNDNNNGGAYNTQLIDQLLLHRRGLTLKFATMEPNVKILFNKFTNDFDSFLYYKKQQRRIENKKTKDTTLATTKSIAKTKRAKCTTTAKTPSNATEEKQNPSVEMSDNSNVNVNINNSSKTTQIKKSSNSNNSTNQSFDQTSEMDSHHVNINGDTSGSYHFDFNYSCSLDDNCNYENNISCKCNENLNTFDSYSCKCNKGDCQCIKKSQTQGNAIAKCHKNRTVAHSGFKRKLTSIDNHDHCSEEMEYCNNNDNNINDDYICNDFDEPPCKKQRINASKQNGAQTQLPPIQVIVNLSVSFFFTPVVFYSSHNKTTKQF